MSYLIREKNRITQLIDEFHGGMTSSIRIKDTKFARVVTNLDIFAAKNQMKHVHGLLR